jgi:hypothetical protein
LVQFGKIDGDREYNKKLIISDQFSWRERRESQVNLGGQTFSSDGGLKDCRKGAFGRDFCFLMGFSCLLGSFYIGLCIWQERLTFLLGWINGLILAGMKILLLSLLSYHSIVD